MGGRYFGSTHCEYRSENGMRFLGEILYVVSVVGGVVNHTGVIYGARIHRTVALRMRLRMYVIRKYFGVVNICK